MEIHEICSIFPMMNPDEYAGLKADIATNGQHEPIWTYQGLLIDGRNRLKACADLGIAPKLREWDGRGSLIEFVVSLNLHRRHLNSGQRAACGTEIEERLAIEAKERQRQNARATSAEKVSKVVSNKERIPDSTSMLTLNLRPKSEPQARDQAAKLVGTNHRYIQDAKAVKAADLELHEKVKNGEITLPQARREVDRVEKRARLEEKAKAVESSPQSLSPTWEIVEGDCLKLLEGEYDDEIDEQVYALPCKPGGVRLVFADPPYNIGIDYGSGSEADRRSSEKFGQWTNDWIQEAAGWLADDGSMWVLINHEWAATVEDDLRHYVGPIRAWVTWYESFGVNCSNNFNRTSRRLLYAVKDPRRFVFNPDAVSRLSDRQVKYADKRAEPGGKIWDDVWGINPPIPRLVDNAKERIPDFPTQLPLALLSAVVGCASEPGNLVMDPFSGSGTTGEAAIRLGRRYVGIERNPEYAKVSRMRLMAAKGELDATGR